jgi:hypothetical protein
MRVRLLGIALAASCSMAMLPATASAQSSIAGIVRDASGAVVPGVTVEAQSPALIEKVRTVYTDGQGRYNIVDLRPGTYLITFTLPGFSTVRREGIDLQAAFTATVNAEMNVGALEEIVTVTSEAPLVDVQRTALGATVSKELLESVPTTRMVQRLTAFLPGVQQFQSGPSSNLGADSAILSIHGSRGGESNVMLEGISTRHMGGPGGSGGVRLVINQAMVQETAVSLGSAGAEQQMGAIMTNVIPRQGGNTFSGLTYFHYTNERFSSDNVSDELTASGLGAAGQIRESWDINPALGGPIVRDKLWFFASYRHWGDEVDGGIHYNLTPTTWAYTPDLSRKTAATRFSYRNQSARLTWQASRRNQFSLYVDNNPRWWYNRRIATTVSPEAATYTPYYPNYIATVTWKSPVSSRLFLEVNSLYGSSNNLFFPNTDLPNGADPKNLISAVELNTGMNFRSGNSFGFQGKSANFRVAASASYATGTHTLKAGMDFYNGSQFAWSYRTGDMEIRLRNAQPANIALFAPNETLTKLKADLGIYVQDRWTVGRLTTNVGLRYDYFNSYADSTDAARSEYTTWAHVPPNRWVSAFNYPAVKGVPLWHDLSPRLGVAYDVFGNGTTGLKATLSRYVEGQTNGIATQNNPVVTSVLSATRTWTDRNGDFVPDCDFGNFDANGECGSISNRNFGQRNPNATQWDPEVLNGFGKRGYNWEASFQVQQQLNQRLAVTAGYSRRSFGGTTSTQNVALGRDPSVHYNPYCVTLPVDSRLPDNGGNQLCGFYDVTAAMRGVVQNFVTHTSHFGERKEMYNGLDLTFNARFANGGQVSGGPSTGRTAIDTCYVVNSPQELLFCDVTPPFQAIWKIMGVQPLPWWGLQVSGAFQSLPGAEILTTYEATNAEIVPTLRRNLSAGATATVSLPITKPGTMYARRWNQLDVRASKIFRVGDVRMLGNFDMFNVFNSDGVLSVNDRYGPLWQRPTGLIAPRLVRLGLQVDF